MDQLDYLYDRSLLIINFMLNCYPDDNYVKSFKEIITTTYIKKDLKQLKTLSRDINSWAKGLSNKQIHELEIKLKDNFGENLSGEKITTLQVKKVLKDKKINTEEDYRVLHEYVSDISSNDSLYKKREDIELMLMEYIKKNS